MPLTSRAPVPGRLPSPFLDRDGPPAAGEGAEGSSDSEETPRRPGLSVVGIESDSGGTRSELDDVLDEFTGRWERGEAPRAEAFLARLAAGPEDDAVGLVYHEFCLAESSGLRPDPSDYLLRFPAYRDRLARLFGLHEALGGPISGPEGGGAPASLPEAGDEVGPFRLLRELGRGGFARVFLAEQEDLDDRLVVVKVAARASAEPRLLARARHPHIVEVIRHDRTSDGALHLICMPFLGGATLAAVLADRRRRGARPRSGRDLLAGLDRVSDPAYPAPRPGRPAREVLAASSPAAAVAWIVARLAEALDHAHDRGVAHGDLKPANVLLTADGQPMLLDFNLAVDWGRADPDAPAGDPGGTLAYMAPERLRAVADPGLATPPRALDRHRADLYALGLILRELLGGPPPPVPAGPGRSPRAVASAMAEDRAGPPALSGVPRSLRPILARCLAPEAADRYGRAAELAEDLDRWRADLPPAFAPASPWGSAPRRWARRRRRPMAVAALCGLAAALAILAVGRSHRQTLRDQALAKLEAAWAYNEPGVYRFRVGWRARPDGDPAALAARLLARYGVLGPGDWRARPDVRHLPEGDRADLEAWMMEQVWRLATALRARPASPGDWRRALDGLDRASAIVSLSPLESLRRDLRARLRLPEPPAAPDVPPAPPGMEDFLRGVEAEPLRAREALGHYLDALRARPDAFWAHYRAAVVACRLGASDSAADHLARCLRRLPDNPALRAQRAACLQSARRPGDALDESDRALAIDPDFPEAYRNRLFVRADQGQPEALREDLARCEILTRLDAPDAVRKLRWDVRALPGVGPTPLDRDDALRRALAADPGDVRLRYEWARRLDAAGRPGDALAHCDAILAAGPDDLPARYFRAALLQRLGRDDSAREFAALLAHPRFGELLDADPKAVRTYHQVSRAHLQRGEIPEALAVAREGLAQADRLGAMQGESHYCLARAYAVAARSEPALVRRAASHLNQAAARSSTFLDGWFARDSAFDPVRTALRPRLATPPSRPDPGPG